MQHLRAATMCREMALMDGAGQILRNHGERFSWTWPNMESSRPEGGRWTWESHDVSIEVNAKAVEPGKRVMIEWPGYSIPAQVEWTFQALPDATTFVRVTESGWTGSADQLARYAADSTQGLATLMDQFFVRRHEYNERRRGHISELQKRRPQPKRS